MHSLDVVTPLEPQDALYRGITEAIQLHKEASVEEVIKNYDVMSLYPFVIKTGQACTVLGLPTETFGDISSYEGLIKCKISPPRGICIPVLPAKVNGKLLFTLCITCAKTKQQAPCHHTKYERVIVGTWVTDEVKKAIQKGYNIEINL